MIELLHIPALLAASDPVAHVIDHPIGGQMVFSNVTLMLIIASLITIAILVPAAKKITTGGTRDTVDDFRAQGPLANFVEVVCLYLREEVFRPIFHEQTDRYMPILWTFFWFILVCNILGLLPFVDITGGIFGLNHGHGHWGTATQSIYVTGALAFVAFCVINIAGLMKDPVGYVKHLSGGIPFSIPMIPVIAIMVVVEFIGIFVKPFALAIRLFANMTGGHIMLAVLFSFVPTMIESMGAVGYGMAILPILGGAAIFALELLVAFLQAFIFTFLTGLFLGQLVHHDHEHEHQPEDYEERPGLEHGPLA